MTNTPTPIPENAAVSAPKSGSRRRTIILVAATLVLALALWRGWVWYSEGRFIVSTDDAYVRADVTVIAARDTGHVLRVLVEDQQKVKAGDLLAEIDPGDYAIAVAAAESKIATQDATIARIAAQAKAQGSAVAQAKAQAVVAKTDVARTVAQYDRSVSLGRQNFATPQQIEQALADRDRTRAAVDVAAAGVESAEATQAVFEAQRNEAEHTRAELQTVLDKARRDLEFTRVIAPFDGVVGNKAVQAGQYVLPGTRLLALVPMDSAYVEANFKETQLAGLKIGQRVEITVDALGSRRVEGRVAGLSPATGAQFSLLPPENATGNFTKIVQRLPVRIEVAPEVAREGVLRAGLSVTVEVHTRDTAPTATAAVAKAP